MHSFVHVDEFSASVTVFPIFIPMFKSIPKIKNMLAYCINLLFPLGQTGNIHYIMTVIIKPRGEFMLINDDF